MNNVILLTKVFLKSAFQFNIGRNNEKKKNSKVNKIVYAIIALYLTAIFGYLSYMLISTLMRNWARNTIYRNLFAFSFGISCCANYIFWA